MKANAEPILSWNSFTRRVYGRRVLHHVTNNSQSQNDAIIFVSQRGSTLGNVGKIVTEEVVLRVLHQIIVCVWSLFVLFNYRYQSLVLDCSGFYVGYDLCLVCVFFAN